MGQECIIALDAGTTSVRAIVFDAAKLVPLHAAQQEFAQHYPADGWVEHDAEEIWTKAEQVLKQARDYAQSQSLAVLALGITNQRETVVLWERESGRPLHRAIVWQDRRTAARCEQLREIGAEDEVQAATGLLLDPYFSATKLAWLLDETGSRPRAEAGEVLAGTIDTFLIWRLTGGRVFATDVTNASRTMLFALSDMDWDENMLQLHGVPRACLPQILPCADDFGCAELLGKSVPIGGVAGDQQAAAIGQACLSMGETKATYGTGCFVITQSGCKPPDPGSGLLGTVGYRVGSQTRYAVEGSIFVAGSAIQWLRDRLHLLTDASESESLAAASEAGGVYLVPAFAGLGAPHWNPHARGALLGLTLDTGPAQIVRAALEGIACQTVDLAQAYADAGLSISHLRVDGGMAANSLFVQMLADLLGIPVERPVSHETTSAGAAFLAGLQVGAYASLEDMRALWSADREFAPAMDADVRKQRLAGWRRAVAAAASYADQARTA